VTARRVYLVRHGRAEGASAAGDAGRRLTPEGRNAFEAHVRNLSGSMTVARVVASPYVRCRETAEILERVLGVPTGPEPELASGASDAGAVLRLAALHGGGTALVGHNPELAGAVALVAGVSVGFPPGAIAALDLEGDEVRLAWIRVP
jgi:phosphohistidine phosphatase